MIDDKVKLPRIGPSEITNTSRVIHKGPCIVKAVHVAGDGAGCEVVIIDGVNSSGKVKAIIIVLSGSSYTWRPGEGTDFDYGIYVNVNASTTKVTVTYIPESRKDFI